MNANVFVDVLTANSQNHILNHFWSLSAEKQAELLRNAEDLDFDLVFRLYRECTLRNTEAVVTPHIRPPRVIPLSGSLAHAPSRNEAKIAGETLISQGKVAVLIVAGGQGVRLGHNKPKGTFPVSPLMNKTLFQLFCEQVRALSLRYQARIPLLLMTSYENHADTVAFFNTFDFFGLDATDVHFFQQGMLPTVTPRGQLLLKDETSFFVNPDGHGGSLKALCRSGLLDYLLNHGFSDLFYCQVDNPLVRIADPVFLGYHALARSECSTKVVRRQRIEEKVGVYVTLREKDAILEYSDFGGKHMEAIDETGSILYWAGNTAIHALSLPFVKKINDHSFALPYHCANKTVEMIHGDGTQTSVNVWKFETFVFDAIPLAERTCCVEVDRAEEFSPVKNREGQDSPATARQSMTNLHRSWLRDAGIFVPPNLLVEISPLFALDKEEVIRKLKGKILSVEKDTYFG